MKTELGARTQKAGARAENQTAAPALDAELRKELSAIFAEGRSGFSGGVDNFIHAEIGMTYTEGKGYEKSARPLREKAAIAAAVLQEMKDAHPDAFRTAPHSGDPQKIPAEGERLYLQSMLEQLESVAKTGELFVKVGEPTQAKRARTLLPQLLEHDDDLPVRR